MTPFKNFSRNTIKSLKKGIVLTSMTGTLLFTSCGNNVEYVQEEVVEMTKGVVTTVEEVSPDEFRIVDEQVIDDKNASQVIANYISGDSDTMNLAEVQDWSGGSGNYDSNSSTASNTTSSDTTRHYRRRSGIGSIIMYGYMGYMMGRTTSPNPAAYKNQSTYNRVSNSTGSTLNKTAKRTTVSKPSKTKSGYGSGKSTRSYGG